VFRRAYAVSLDLHQASLQFPKIEQFGGLADQIRRASKSICANLAEGFGKQRQSNLEFKRYLLMAVGSSDEMQVWLKIARTSNTSIGKRVSVGETSIARSRACCRASTPSGGLVLITDYRSLTPGRGSGAFCLPVKADP
jgi:four helix bundle protein